MGYEKELKFLVNREHQGVSHLRQPLWKESSSSGQVLTWKVFVNMLLILMTTDTAILKAMYLPLSQEFNANEILPLCFQSSHIQFCH